MHLLWTEIDQLTLQQLVFALSARCTRESASCFYYSIKVRDQLRLDNILTTVSYLSNLVSEQYYEYFLSIKTKTGDKT